MHLEYFYQYDIKSYIDLYYDVGETLMDKNLFEDALTTYEAILSTVKVSWETDVILNTIDP